MAKADLKEDKETELEKVEEVYPEFKFVDLQGNNITVKPWSFRKSKQLCKVLGSALSDIKKECPQIGFENLMEYLDVILMKVPDKVGEILYKTVDRGEEWLEMIDNAMVTKMFGEVLWQNFLSPRVTSGLGKVIKLKQIEERNPTLDGSMS